MLFSSTTFSKNVAICFDGTGNDATPTPNTDDATTNVHILCEELISPDTIVKYIPGVGTEEFAWFDEKGELIGWGANAKKEEAEKFLLKQNLNDTDNLYVFGYSRGAAIARDFVNSSKVKSVRFLGLWDTVAAFGIPIDILDLPFQKTNWGKKLDVPTNKVDHTVHAVAIDEKRHPFYPTLVKEADNVEEVWFTGVHSDIGGGYKQRELAEISLKFMLERADEHDLDFIDISDRMSSNSQADIRENQGNFKIQQRDIVVLSDIDKIGNSKPKIHTSVLTRIKELGDASIPENVLKLQSGFIEWPPQAE